MSGLHAYSAVNDYRHYGGHSSGKPSQSQSDSLSACLAQGSARRYDVKEFVFVEGDPARLIYRIETGAVSLFKILPDGRRQILGFAYAGDIIGLGVQGEHIMSAQAIKPLRIRSLPLAALHEIAVRDPGLCFTLYQAIAESWPRPAT
ncbi:MAG: cyclic nucleotide-binding domain-containing protein [Rhodomicrobium sp.]|nr:cyclic nucleotide-binding domain-containing protein [Rhodomicrobium sp.]